jgi:hypothetical protein
MVEHLWRRPTSAGLWREHAAQAEEREKAELLKAAAD